MTRKQTAGNWILIVVIGLCLLIFSSGCSNRHPLAGAGGSGHASTHAQVHGDLSEQEIRHSMSRIRPYEDPEHYYRRGRYFQDHNKHDLAIQEFKSVISWDPENPDAYNAMGISFDNLAKHDKAIHAYNAAIKHDPGRADILNNLGYSHLLRDDIHVAIMILNKAVAMEKGNSLYRSNLALAHVENGNFDAALSEFRQSGDPASLARIRLARILYHKGDKEKAEEQILFANVLEETDRYSLEMLYKRPSTISVAEITEEDDETAPVKSGTVTMTNPAPHESIE